MAWEFIRYDRVFEGGYRFEQKEGINHKFKRTNHLDGLIAEVSDFRSGNNLPRASRAEVKFDIVQYECQRRGGNGCYNTDKTQQKLAAPVVRQARSGCAGCGARIGK